MYKAVQTAPARKAWNEGACVAPRTAPFSGPPDQVFVIEFPPRVLPSPP
jgi:hypothetical protein